MGTYSCNWLVSQYLNGRNPALSSFSSRPLSLSLWSLLVLVCCWCRSTVGAFRHFRRQQTERPDTIRRVKRKVVRQVWHEPQTTENS